MLNLARRARVASAIRRRLRATCCLDASTLVVAEHNNVALSPSSLSAVTAAGEIKGDVTVLVVGYQAKSVAEQVLWMWLAQSCILSAQVQRVVPLDKIILSEDVVVDYLSM